MAFMEIHIVILRKPACMQLSNTVVFERPLEEAFVRKWQLACEADIAHVVVMPNITVDKLEEFVQVRMGITDR